MKETIAEVLTVLAVSTMALLFVKAASAEQAAQANANLAPMPEFDINCSALASADFSGILDAPTQVTSAIPIQAVEDLPAYCQLKGYVFPSVGIELALPTPWNGKFMEGGCGGHCGLLDPIFAWSCGGALRKGYACVISDMGHKGTGGDGLWASENLQAKVDWGYRATHVAALAGKAITERFYHQAPAKSYYAGCSTGGRQGLQEAQRFPWDFDGIIAGAPPVNLSTLYMTFAWGVRVTSDQSAKPLLGQRELKLLTDAAVAKCDLDDGVKDGIIGDPVHCKFDPAELTCREGQQNACLTPAQVESVRKVYAGPMNSKGEKLSPGGPLPGSEFWKSSGDVNDWRAAYVGVAEKPADYEPLVVNGFQYLFFWPELGRNWRLRDFDFDRDYKRLGAMEVLYDSSDPDLRKFKAAGGKLLVYQGTNDISVLPRSTIDYYETVERTIGGQAATQSFFRLFILPSVEHCAGGPGADTVDYLSYLEAWVERGEAPDQLLAAHMKEPYPLVQPPAFPLDPKAIAFTRPVYPYPARAKYKGRGDPNDAANFSPTSH